MYTAVQSFVSVFLYQLITDSFRLATTQSPLVSERVNRLCYVYIKVTYFTVA